MASQLMPKLSKYIPLWQRRIPDYPVYWKGNPQLRVYLPLFWMKMMKAPKAMVPDSVLFEVHPQMTQFDVKQYLEKIYGVSVVSVNCKLIRGKDRHDPRFGFSIQPEADKRIAYVQMSAKDMIKFPEMFEGKPTEEEKSAKDYAKASLENEKIRRNQWSRMDMPVWFR